MAKITFKNDYSDSVLRLVGDLTEENVLKWNDGVIASLKDKLYHLTQMCHKMDQLAAAYGQDKAYYIDIKTRLTDIKVRVKYFLYDDTNNGIAIVKDGLVSNADQMENIKDLNDKITNKYKMILDYFHDLIDNVEIKAQNAKPKNTNDAKCFESFLRKDPADMEGLKNYISQQKGKKFAACLEILQQHGFISENLAVESFMRSIFPDMEKSRYQAVVNKYYKADEDGFTFISYDEKYIKSIVNEIVEFL